MLCKSLSERGMSGVGGGSEDEADDRCVRCGRDDNAHEMLECDSCDAGWHMCFVRHHTPPIATQIGDPVSWRAQALPAAGAQADPGRRVVLPFLCVAGRAPRALG